MPAGVVNAETLDFLGRAKLPSSKISNIFTVKGSIGGGLDVRCHPSHGLLVAGSLSTVVEGVAYVSNELETPELRDRDRRLLLWSAGGTPILLDRSPSLLAWGRPRQRTSALLPGEAVRRQ